MMEKFKIRQVVAVLPKPLPTLLRGLVRLLRWTRWKLSSHPWGYPLPSGGLVNELELRPHYRKALCDLQRRLGADGIGDYVEFGVYRGSSLLLMYDELLRAGLSKVRLFGFDSFAGLPRDDEGFWKEGEFCADYDLVVRSLNRRGVDWGRVTLVKGFFTDTLTDALKAKQALDRVSLIMIDCDLYSAAKEALDFCGPLIRNEAVIFFDDWNPLAKDNKGEKRAFDEFLQENPWFKAEAVGEYSSFTPGDFNGKVFRLCRTLV